MLDKTKQSILKASDRQLKKWRDERRLSVESQHRGLVGNLLEEALEFTRAQSDSDRIDALCDICVFSLNSMSGYLGLGEPEKYNIGLHHLIKGIGNAQLCLKLLKSEPAHKSNASYNLDLALVSLCYNALAMIEKAGYCPDIAMQETIKEISSRTGRYDENIGKWVKDTSPEAKAKWYKADYEKARR